MHLQLESIGREGMEELIMAALDSRSCTSLKEICYFKGSKFLLDPSNWKQQPQDIQTKDVLNPATVRKFEKNALASDLHSMGLGEIKASAMLVGLLPRVAVHLTSLNIR